jgi:hypothetical protein
MNWNQHRNLEGSHAFLSASKYSWLSKTNEEIVQSYTNSFAQAIGTLSHAFAADYIRFREKLRKGDSRTLKMDLMRRGIPEYAIDIRAFYPTVMRYVNDSIDFMMDPEVLLYYCDLCFGTADSIQVSNGVLRIHDLKTGTTQAHMEQLIIYAALFCLEYGVKPSDISIELRIYQSDEIVGYIPEADEIVHVMDKIIYFDKLIKEFKSEE